MALLLSSFIILGATLCGIFCILLYHMRRLRVYKMAAKFPGPSTLPVVGNALYLVGRSEDLLQKMLELAQNYASPFRFWLGGQLFFGVYDAEQAKIILKSPKTYDRNFTYEFLRSLLGMGLLTAPTSKWKVHRRLLNPTFSIAVLEGFVPIYAKQAEILVKQLECELHGKQFDMYHYIAKCTLDIICETAMGVSVNAQTDHECYFLEAVDRMSEITFKRALQIWLHPDIIFNHTQLGRDQRKYMKYINEYTDTVIQNKKQIHFRMKNEEDNIADDHQPRKKAFLELILDLSKDGTQFTDQEIRDEVITMIAGGNDTTGITNSFALLMLAMHQDVQEKVYEELCQIYGHDHSENIQVNKEDLPRMVYLEYVIKETMRLFPAIPSIARLANEDLQIGELTFPKGSSVGILITGLHRNELYWPNPLIFDPDRFLPEECAKRHPYAFLPFSTSPRNCIGLRYAMMSMKAVLATVLWRYIIKKDDIVPVADVQFKQEIVLKAVGPVLLRIEDRRAIPTRIQ